MAVLELSSWQCEGLQDIRKSPSIAVMTNLMQDHLNRYPSLKAYSRAKAMIFAYQQRRDCAVLNFDDRRVRQMARRVKGRCVWFSRTPLAGNLRGAYEKDGALWLKWGATRHNIIAASRIGLIGEHQRSNALAAIAAAAAAGATIASMRSVLGNTRPIKGRLELIRTLGGVMWYNDTAATTPEATQAALEALYPKGIILIAGGMDKRLSYASLAPLIMRYCRMLILLPGSASRKLHALMKEHRGGNRVRSVATLDHAVLLAHRIANRGEAVILSPAAASFNQFRHSVQRGECFARAVQHLKSRNV